MACVAHRSNAVDSCWEVTKDRVAGGVHGHGHSVGRREGSTRGQLYRSSDLVAIGIPTRGDRECIRKEAVNERSTVGARTTDTPAALARRIFRIHDDRPTRRMTSARSGGRSEVAWNRPTHAGASMTAATPASRLPERDRSASHRVARRGRSRRRSTPRAPAATSGSGRCEARSRTGSRACGSPTTCSDRPPP